MKNFFIIISALIIIVACIFLGASFVYQGHGLHPLLSAAIASFATSAAWFAAASEDANPMQDW